MSSNIESKLNKFLSSYEGSTIHLKDGQVIPFDHSSLKGLVYRAIIEIEIAKSEIKKLNSQIKNVHSGSFKHKLEDFVKDMKNPDNLAKFKADLLAMQKDITDSLNKESAS